MTGTEVGDMDGSRKDAGAAQRAQMLRGRNMPRLANECKEATGGGRNGLKAGAIERYRAAQ